MDTQQVSRIEIGDTKEWKLRRTAQCEKCPWRVDVNPHDIPNGYDVEKHEALRNTIADPKNPFSTVTAKVVHIMACHETQDAHCIGWLVNQIGDGGNIAMRLKMGRCTNGHKIRLRGPQHATFDDTLPKEKA